MDEDLSIEFIKINLIILGAAITAVNSNYPYHAYLVFVGFGLFILVIVISHITLLRMPDETDRSLVPMTIYLNFTAIGTMGEAFLIEQNPFATDSWVIFSSNLVFPTVFVTIIVLVHLYIINKSAKEIPEKHINHALVSVGITMIVSTLSGIYIYG